MMSASRGRIQAGSEPERADRADIQSVVPDVAGAACCWRRVFWSARPVLVLSVGSMDEKRSLLSAPRSAYGSNSVAPASKPRLEGPDLSFRKEAQKYERYRRSRWVIRINSASAQRWDIVVLLVLLYTATVTVYQITVPLSLDPRDYGRLAFDLLVDTIFIVDTVLTFFREVRDERGRLFTTLADIRTRYLRNGFMLDLLSCTPVLIHVLSTVEEDSMGWGRRHAIRSFALLRIVRIIRLARIVRLVARSQLVVQLELNASHVVVDLAKLTFAMLMLNHWAACLLVLTARIEVSDDALEDSWLTKYKETQENTLDLASDRDVYLLALYWSVMTVTSIGYGDVTPVTPSEFFVITFEMILGAVIWTYVIGRMTGMVSLVEGSVVMARKRMADLNDALEEMGEHISAERATALRRYIFALNNSSTAAEDRHRELVESLSPALQGVWYAAKRRRIVGKIWFLHPYVPMPGSAVGSQHVPHMRDSTLLTICRSLSMRTYARNERFQLDDSIGIVRHGVGTLLEHNRVLGRHSVWGEENVLSAEDTRKRFAKCRVRTLTFMEIYTLPCAILVALAEHDASLRRGIVRAVTFYGMLAWARKTTKLSRDGHLANVQRPSEVRHHSLIEVISTLPEQFSTDCEGEEEEVVEEEGGEDDELLAPRERARTLVRQLNSTSSKPNDEFLISTKILVLELKAEIAQLREAIMSNPDKK